MACLLYNPDDATTCLQFPDDVGHSYNEQVWEICEAMKAKPLWMVARLTPLLIDMLNSPSRIPESAIILKVLHDAVAGFEDSRQVSGPIFRAQADRLREMVNSSWCIDGEVGGAVFEQICRVIAELWYCVAASVCQAEP